MCTDNNNKDDKRLAFDFSKVKGSTYYARKGGKVVALHIGRLCVKKDEDPSRNPRLIMDITFADGDVLGYSGRVMPDIYFTAEDALNGTNRICEMETCGYYRSLRNHGYRFSEETDENGAKAMVCYVWDENLMKVRKLQRLPYFDCVNGGFYVSLLDCITFSPAKVYKTLEDCAEDNKVEVVEFSDTADTKAEFCGIAATPVMMYGCMIVW